MLTLLLQTAKIRNDLSTVLLKIHIFITTTTTNGKKKIYINVDSHSMAFKAALQGGALRRGRGERGMGAESRVSTLYDKMK